MDEIIVYSKLYFSKQLKNKNGLQAYFNKKVEKTITET